MPLPVRLALAPDRSAFKAIEAMSVVESRQR
jgi:hypothetical protein